MTKKPQPADPYSAWAAVSGGDIEALIKLGKTRAAAENVVKPPTKPKPRFWIPPPPDWTKGTL